MSNKKAIKIISVIFLLFASSAKANDDVCSADDIKNERNKFMILFNAHDYLGAANLLEPLFSKCYEALSVESVDNMKIKKMYFWAFGDYSLALLKLKNYKKCLSEGKSLLDNPFPMYEDRKSPEISAIEKNIKSCEISWEEQFKAYTSIPCGANFSYSKSISVAAPSAWLVPEGAKTCISIHTGTVDDKNLDYHEGGRHEAMDRPYVIEANVTGEKTTEKFYAFSSGHLGSSEYQAPGKISLGGSEKHKLIRIKGYSSFLWRGSASVEVDAIYELKKDGTTELLDEIVITYH